MSIKIMNGATEMFNINSGFSVNFNFSRYIQKTAVAYTGQVFLYDMITTEFTYTITADLSIENTGYSDMVEIYTKLKALMPNSGVEYSLVDSGGIFNVSKCIVEDISGSDNPQNPLTFTGVSLKIVEYTTNFTAV